MDDRRRVLCPAPTEHAGTRARGACRRMERPAEGEGAGAREARAREAPRRRERKGVAKRAERPPRKAAMARRGPVPKTDAGGRGENPKAGGRSVAKELGKMAP